jgi:hypothetical protein
MLEAIHPMLDHLVREVPVRRIVAVKSACGGGGGCGNKLPEITRGESAAA